MCQKISVEPDPTAEEGREQKINQLWLRGTKKTSRRPPLPLFTPSHLRTDDTNHEERVGSLLCHIRTNLTCEGKVESSEASVVGNVIKKRGGNKIILQKKKTCRMHVDRRQEAKFSGNTL